jgi:hypothetical protein
MQRCVPPFRIVLLVALTVGAVMPSVAGGFRLMRNGGDDQAAIAPIDTASEPSDPAERALRQLRSSRYDNSGLLPLADASDSAGLGDEIHFSVTHSRGIAAPLPIGESNTIVIGEVVNAQPYLSNDGTGLYSEFAIRVETVLKNDCSGAPHPNGTVVAEREGGALRLPDGRVLRYRAQDAGLPSAGRRYAFFLARNEQGDDFSILRLYELCGSHVLALDPVAREADPASSETGFLKALRDAIVDSQ